ncbi:MAG: monovalent cation/H+ antiporter subunit D [Gammaproteobacteria bacterium]|nr:monovalent cation/H+ antiporter subunit D [Gammaproteobacteria bacterium]
MSHWIILPIVLPLLSGLLLLMGRSSALLRKRLLSLLSTLMLLPLALYLLYLSSDGDYQVYALGNWAAPYGIVLVLDRLAALMLALTALLALPAVWYASRGDDARGRHFHALFQFQLMGLNGAFLTGDLFNLFVFFEVLLIASYALLLFGGGRARSRAGLHYVLLNLAGSSLFLIALGVLYGVTGTLNMADLAGKVAAAEASEAGLLHAAALLLLLVFALKAALLPLYFWLPTAYSAASAPVAALFAIMTKVGVYAIVRVYTLIFGAQAGLLANVADGWLWPLALATLLLGAIGALAAGKLRTLVAYLVIVSVGMLLAAVSLHTPEALAGALYYLLHTTLVSGGLFLLAGLIRHHRGPAGDHFITAARMLQQPPLGILFFIGAVAVAGLPPLSGFVGKLVLLTAVPAGEQQAWFWAVVLGSGLITIVALSRAGSRLFWKTDESTPAGHRLDPWQLAPTLLLVAVAPLLLSLFARPVMEYTGAAAAQLLVPEGYVAAVLGSEAPLPATILQGGVQ